MFDIKEDVEVEPRCITTLMEQLDIFISIKPKPKQPSKVWPIHCTDCTLYSLSVRCHQKNKSAIFPVESFHPASEHDLVVNKITASLPPLCHEMMKIMLFLPKTCQHFPPAGCKHLNLSALSTEDVSC